MTDKDKPSSVGEEYRRFKKSLYFPDAAIVRPTWDHAFKAIFVKNRELTLKFVNDFFEFESPITDLSFLGTEIGAHEKWRFPPQQKRVRPSR